MNSRLIAGVVGIILDRLNNKGNKERQQDSQTSQ